MISWAHCSSCHLSLGEAEDASRLFTRCLQTKSDFGLDNFFLKEASEGLEKAQVSLWLFRVYYLYIDILSFNSFNAIGTRISFFYIFVREED